MFNFIKKTILFIRKKLVPINNSVNKRWDLPDKADKTFPYATKLVGSSGGSADVIEAVVCQDEICAILSAVGLAADGLEISTFFLPGPNLTGIIPIPVSIGPKLFVYGCKKSKLAWGGC